MVGSIHSIFGGLARVDPKKKQRCVNARCIDVRNVSLETLNMTETRLKQIIKTIECNIKFPTIILQ